MDKRLALQKKLEDALGSRNVYFQPPSGIKLNYPAIVYKLSSVENRHANNDVYLQDFFYEINVIEKTPNSNLIKDISKWNKISFSSQYTSDNLYHTVFKLYL